jgi:glutamate synthase domain-containing protein 3
VPRKNLLERNVRPQPSADEKVLERVAPALERGEAVRIETPIRNSDLTAGARIAGEVALRYKLEGLPEDTIEVRYKGSAGQSFGAWCTNGMRLILEGEANDYVGKGMCGGEIIVRVPANAEFLPHENVIIGNTVLYGATGGKLFVAGRAGERFAVRNSGAIAVVEGVGDHGCEYMTQGLVVVLGSTGRNFAAGMSWGNAYVLDQDGSFERKLNTELVRIDRVEPSDASGLRALIEEHVEKTGSPWGTEILSRWEQFLPLFWKVSPITVPLDVTGHTVHKHHEEKEEEPAGTKA